MEYEVEQEVKENVETLKQRVFATSFAAFDPGEALKRYFDSFEKEQQMIEEGVEEFVPESEEDVMEMLNTARRAGAIQ